MISYQQENITIEEFKTVLQNSTLAERRPINDDVRLEKMLKHGNIIITARDGAKIVGVSRAMSDFAFCTYLSDLAVDEQYQRQGIGIELIRQTKQAAPLAKLILLAAPKAVDYYPKTGMTKFEHCFLLDNVADLK